MKRIEHYRFTVPLYDRGVLLIRSTPADYVTVLKRYYARATIEDDTPHGEAQSVLLVHANELPMAVIWFAASCDVRVPRWIGTVAHECWHAVWQLGGKIGLEPGTGGEAHAYLHGWLVEACVTRLQRTSTSRRAGRRKK